jgi:soluble lytic murein transglycosylase-like protein
MTHAEANYDPHNHSGFARAGCCSAYAFPPLVVLMIAVGAVAMAFRVPGRAIPASAAPPGTPGAISSIFTREIQHWAAPIAGWSTGSSLDPNLVATVMQIESCGNPLALSRSGAIGLFQVMPYHFEAFDDAYLPDTNAARGLAYLAGAMRAAHGDARLAFAGYNGGIGVIGRAEWAWPDETVRYAYWASGIYADALSGADDSSRLEEWLAAGGASLCRSASEQLGLF